MGFALVKLRGLYLKRYVFLRNYWGLPKNMQILGTLKNSVDIQRFIF